VKKKPQHLVDMYKRFKLNNPIAARKSIRVQQEMLTSAMNLVQQAEHKPTEFMIETEVEATLAKEDEVLPEVQPEVELLSPLEAVHQAAPHVNTLEVEDIVMHMLPAAPPSSGQEEGSDTIAAEADAQMTENLSDASQSPNESERSRAATHITHTETQHLQTVDATTEAQMEEVAGIPQS
jgi:hypothetical protein